MEGRRVAERHQSRAREEPRLGAWRAQKQRRHCAPSEEAFPRTLTISQREEISRGLATGRTFRAIAINIRRAPSTIGREIYRNGGRSGYRAERAEERAVEQAQRPKMCILARRPNLRRVVAKKLRENWSPQQISGWLRRRYARDDSMHVSHETLYRSLFIQARGVLKKELISHLRSRRMMRCAKVSTSGKVPTR